ncbi:MAG: hypothetical protein HN929_01860 [Chloroflexi bacterium]|jgi:hypothetical protein|nr:hypothetical protein [Chloroflexota bacterium]MBT7080206.1 hypothetical protein [Chloroflexota bacterium]MBT7290152.1 hypothetical protein [Chloroflexota bacterium]
MTIPDTELNYVKLRYRKMRNIGIGFGFALMLVEIIMLAVAYSPFYQFLTFVVLGAWVWGGSYWAKYKGRDDFWSLIMIFGPLGYIILMRLEDKWPWEKMKHKRRKKFTRE